MSGTPQDPIEADRLLVIGQLRRAAEEGRLAPHELDERIAAARSARSPAELTAVAVGPQPVAAPVGYPAAGYRPDDPLVLTGGFSRERRDGIWTVPPLIRVSALGSSVRINCLQASAAAPVIDLLVSPGAATVLLVLPDGWAVNTDRLGKGLGSVTVRVPREPEPGCPLFLVHGHVGLGRFTARPGSRREKRRLPTG